jgi:peptidyl-prolyl cis-trans isomerase SurA
MKKLVLAFFALGSIETIKAQDPTIMTINNREISKSEFEAVYKKNNGKEVNAGSKSVREYVDLFSLFKMKVIEAESLGLDTLSSFKTELAGYRRQLAAPYLTDKNTNETLITEAYERMKTEVRASHILVRVDETALPKDTLESYMRIQLIRNALLGKAPTSAQIAEYDKLLKNNFEVGLRLKKKDSVLYNAKMGSVKGLGDLLKTAGSNDNFPYIAPKTSDDPSVVDNKGDLNYFSALDMVYQFEAAAYTTKVGDVSPIVRTRFGYHVLKVYDKRAARGEMYAAHIMVKTGKEADEKTKENAKTKIDEIYQKLKAGDKFEDLARQFSDDGQSKDRGGQLQPFKSGRLPKDFEEAAFKLAKNDDFSMPVQTEYGWHIIKRLDRKELASFNDMKNDIKMRVGRDGRSQMGREALIARVKKENNFIENFKNRDEVLKSLDTNFLKANWKAESVNKFGNKEIISLGTKKYTQLDFAKYLESQMTVVSDKDAFELGKRQYKTWVETAVVDYEDQQLEKKYPDFRNLLREYRDGILLFDITDQKVWSKAVKDSAGLKEYYEKNKTKFMWEERADVTTYKCLNDKMAKELRKLLKKGKGEKEIVEMLNKTSQLNVAAENVTYLKGENKNVDANWKQGVAEKDIKDEKENKVLVLVVNKIQPRSPKTLGESRGMVTADYQNHLDTEWLAYLKNKYKVTVKEDVLSTVK